MSDVSKYLPLSRRARHDESAVTGDWSTPYRATLEALADLLDGVGADGWQLGTQRAGVTVHDAVVELLWRLETPRAARSLAAVGRILARQRPAASHPFDTPADLTGRLRVIAAEARVTRLAELSAAVLAALDVARSIGTPLRLDPTALGAVAVARALSAPLPIRAVVGARTFTATDATWQIGRGPAFRATAADIVLFLFGRTGLPVENLAAPVERVDTTQLEPLWAQIQPFLTGLDSGQIVDKVGAWANDLNLPLVVPIPDAVIGKIQRGVTVPLQQLLAG